MKGLFNFAGLDEYLRLVERAGMDIDQAAIEAVEIASQPIEAEMHAKIAPFRKSGETEASIFMTPVQTIGSYHFVEVGAQVDDDSAALYNEFGTVYREPHSFVRAAIHSYGHRWHNAIKAYLKSYMGVAFE